MRSVVALLVAAAVGAAGCGSPERSADPRAGTAERSGTTLPASPTELPTFDMAGYEQLLAELRGKPVVVNLWAAWCGPCEAEAPHLARVSREFEGRVQFLGVDVLDQRPNAVAFIRKHGWTYPSLFDPTGEIIGGLGFLGPPVTFLFDAKGRQVMVVSGPITEQKLRAEITKVL